MAFRCVQEPQIARLPRPGWAPVVAPPRPSGTTGGVSRVLGAVLAPQLAVFSQRRCRRRHATGEFSEASLQGLTVKELKKMCKERKLQVKGNKADLVHRLLQFTDSMVGQSQEDELYTQAQRELHGFEVSDLRELCQERDLSSEGSKVELVKRLAAHQASKSLEESAEVAEASVARSVASPEERISKALARDSEQDLRQVVQDIFEVGRPKPGEIVTGVVTSVVEWGAFVELDKDGWSALLHISEISDTFIENIEEYICPGQRVEALVLQSPIDRMDRLSLSIKRLKDLQRYDPEALATVGALQPVARPNLVREEAFDALQERVAALEAIVTELGHGQALRDARSDASTSTRRSRVAPLSEMLEDLNDGTDAKAKEPVAAKREKAAIDRVIDSLLAGSSDV